MMMIDKTVNKLFILALFTSLHAAYAAELHKAPLDSKTVESKALAESEHSEAQILFKNALAKYSVREQKNPLIRRMAALKTMETAIARYEGRLAVSNPHDNRFLDEIIAIVARANLAVQESLKSESSKPSEHLAKKD